ncbi:uncharacterized protein [Primulina eburnea]|uniref:uncharacterized protein n=1 Tax=Primulina eburnea TaxID=1245227 RepID=UPI003C6C3E1A
MVAEGWIKSIETLSWTEFKEVFFANYFTEEVRSRLTREFMTLRQGDSSVADFVKRVAGPTTYAVSVSRALAAEQDQRDIEADRLGKRPYQAPPQPQHQHQHQRPQHKRPYQGPPGKKPYQGPPKGKGPVQQQGAPQKPVIFPVCPKCNCPHSGQCLYGSGKCFKCGASDHMLKECPQWKQPTQGRVFAMHAQEANPDTTLLTGNIFIKRLATTTLIDSGATHSFISETFANHLDIKSIGQDINFSVTVPSGEELLATSVIRYIDLEFQGHLVYADLIILPMPEFDKILGMDWLARN